MAISEGVDASERSSALVDQLERLFRAEVDRVHSYARARLGATEAEEVVADVFQAAALAVRDGNEAALAPAWIMTVTRNKVIDRWRRAQRRKVRDSLFRTRERDRLVVMDDWTDPGNREEVIATLDRLSSNHRMALVLHYVDGMPAPDIADQLGQSVAAVESMLARARRSFRAEFDRLGFSR